PPKPAAAATLAPARTAIADPTCPRPLAGGAFPCRGARVKIVPLLLCSTIALGAAAPACAQMDMPGMTMSAHSKSPAKKKPATRKPAPAAKPKAAAPADKGMASMPGMTMPAPAQSAPTPVPMDHSRMDRMSMAMPSHATHDMSGALGPYPMQRESSGTAWQPDSSEHIGLMKMSGG